MKNKVLAWEWIFQLLVSLELVPIFSCEKKNCVLQWWQRNLLNIKKEKKYTLSPKKQMPTQKHRRHSTSMVKNKVVFLELASFPARFSLLFLRWIVRQTELESSFHFVQSSLGIDQGSVEHHSTFSLAVNFLMYWTETSNTGLTIWPPPSLSSIFC